MTGSVQIILNPQAIGLDVPPGRCVVKCTGCTWRRTPAPADASRIADQHWMCIPRAKRRKR